MLTLHRDKMGRWGTPLSRAGGLSPDAPCPPACEKLEIAAGYFCLGCLAFHPQDQHTIDASTPPPPINPEDKAARKIAEYRRKIGDYEQAVENLDARKQRRLLDRLAAVIAELREKIDEQRKIIDEWAGVPTVYKPNPKLRGGKS